MNFARYSRATFLENTSGWMLLYCWLYTLRLYIAGNFQVIFKSLVEKKKFIHISEGFCKLRFLLHSYFCHFLRQMRVYLVLYAKRMLYSEQSTVLLARRHPNTVLLTNFENLNSILNIFQETHDFLFLTNFLSNYL